MATKIFLKPQSFSLPPYRYADSAAPTSLQTITTPTVSGGTKLLIDKWLSAPFQATFTVSGTITFNVWARETNNNANCGIRIELFKVSNGVEDAVPFAAASFGSELTTTMSAKNWTVTPTSTSFVPDDRVSAYVYVINVGSMGQNQNVLLDYAGPTSGADGDSWFQLTETVGFSNLNQKVLSSDGGAAFLQVSYNEATGILSAIQAQNLTPNTVVFTVTNTSASQSFTITKNPNTSLTNVIIPISLNFQTDEWSFSANWGT